MRGADFDYQRDSMSLDLWRKVIAATLDYEALLNRGSRPQPEEFAAEYREIPQELLTPHLQRMRHEVLSESQQESSKPNATPSVCSQRYTVVKYLRSGGMGEIYLGMDLECDRPVALKKIRRDLMQNHEARRRFHAEAALTAGLEHPGIIPIYGRGVDEEGREFYVMRLITGEGSGTLSDAIGLLHGMHQSEETASHRSSAQQVHRLHEIVRRLKQVADAVDYAHSQGVVHRDLKPSNILYGVYGETWIGDWGLARRFKKSSLQDRQTNRPPTDDAARDWSLDLGNATTEIGTPGYAAPELASGGEPQWLPGVDIFSLGAILFCILHGHPPGIAVEPRGQKLAIPGRTALQAICDKAMASRPADRYQSAKAFRSDLQNWTVGEPVRAHRENLWEQVTQLPRRRSLAASALTSGLLILLASGSFFLWVQSSQKKLLEIQSTQLGIALADSAKLLQETRDARHHAEQSREIAEQEREESELHRQVAESRESLAFDSMLRFQDLLVSSHEVFQNSGLSRLEDRLRYDSKEVFREMIAEGDRRAIPSPSTVRRISYMTLRMAASESLLGEKEEASRLIEEACLWMTKYLDEESLSDDTKQMLEFKLGQLRGMQGNLWLSSEDFSRSQKPLEESIQRLERLSISDLNEDDQMEAVTALVKSLAALSMQRFYAGDAKEAKSLQDEALSRLAEGPSQTYDDAISRVQVHFNMAILSERTGDSDAALSMLELAAVAAEEALTLIDERPGGVQFDDAQCRPTKELLATRAQLVLDRARLLVGKRELEKARDLLAHFLKKEESILIQSPQDEQAQSGYQRVSTFLQSVVCQLQGYPAAVEVGRKHIDIAESLRNKFPQSISNRMFLVQAHHFAGHTSQQFGPRDAAIFSYRNAISCCDEAFENQMRTAGFIYQKLELEVHLLQLSIAEQSSEDLRRQLEQVQKLGEELLEIQGPGGPQVRLARNQFLVAIGILKEAGHQEEALEWEGRWKVGKLLP
jgi:serine/threonine protein kinase